MLKMITKLGGICRKTFYLCLQYGRKFKNSVVGAVMFTIGFGLSLGVLVKLSLYGFDQWLFKDDD